MAHGLRRVLRARCAVLGLASGGYRDVGRRGGLQISRDAGCICFDLSSLSAGATSKGLCSKGSGSCIGISSIVIVLVIRHITSTCLPT